MREQTMNIKQFIFGTKNAMVGKSGSPQNPYVKGAEGRKEWNDRYENMKKSIGAWQKAFFCSIAISIIFAIVTAKMASESRVQPFVVETNNGMPYAVKPMEAISSQDQRLINFTINQFIINARTIVNDTEAEKVLLNKVYAYSANNTISFLHDYYQKNNPFDLSGQYTVTVNIVNSLPISRDTWQITWDETKRSANGGNILGTTRWMANMTYKFGDVNQRFITDNPFGLYVTQVSWSKSQSESNI
jgi:type IV secretion system protein VirB5